MTALSLQPVRDDIPEPPRLPVVGHALGIPGGADALLHVMELAKDLGPIFRLQIFDQELIFVSGADLVAELSDTTRFRKSVHAELVRLRDLGGDGLFTAFNDESNWRKAHDILLPAFSLDAMRDYHSTMVGVAGSLLARWDARADSGEPVDIAADMTRLTFDTIGLCGFGFDLQSFAREEPHPFVGAMTRALNHAQAAGETLPLLDTLQFWRKHQYRKDITLMKDIVDDVVQRRRDSGHTDSSDLLGRMLSTVDKRTGEPLDAENIRNQVITFLIAGHETTSGALSFALHYLAKHPAVLAKAQAEVDALWGPDDDVAPCYADVGRLTYIQQVLNEGLRLWPTAPGYAVEPLEDTVIGGRYNIPRGTSLQILIPRLHRSPEWGDSVESFDPERFSPERTQDRGVHLFKPFGNGERACIGRQFALHEATLVLALVVHRFRLDDHANYQLRISQTLTIKPEGLTLRLARRTPAERRRGSHAQRPEAVALSARGRRASAGGAELLVLHGSNLGTSSGIARDLAAQAEEFGFVSRVAALDDAVHGLPAGTLAVIVASSYNGQPTDDAAHFLRWSQGLEPAALDGVRYAVLGVGDRNWAATYQHIPTVLDERLAAAGASRVIARGVADVAGDFTSAIDGWTTALWSALLPETGDNGTAHRRQPTAAAFAVEAAADNPAEELKRGHGMYDLTVVESAALVDVSHPLGRAKQFVRLRLPAGTRYRTGDHLAVLPRNSIELVERVGARLGFDLDQPIVIRRRGRTGVLVPTDRPVTLRTVLTDYLELQQPPNPDHVRVLAQHCQCPPERIALEKLAADADGFGTQVIATGTSVADLLEIYPSVDLPVDVFIGLLPAMRPRRYSISSSPAARPGEVDLMVSLVQARHRRGAGIYRGTASAYLNDISSGDALLGRVIPCNESFRLATDTPAIVVGAGTGLAPFRAMIQDRLHTQGSAPLVCYFGCDHPDVDYLHRQELEHAQSQGVVSMRPTFSRAPESGHTFVQDRIVGDATEVWNLLQSGAGIRVCGDAGRLVPGVEDALRQVFEKCSGSDDEESASAWLEGLRNCGRYVTDAWSA